MTIERKASSIESNFRIEGMDFRHKPVVMIIENLDKHTLMC